jgi:hypothetical protein
MGEERDEIWVSVRESEGKMAVKDQALMEARY